MTAFNTSGLLPENEKRIVKSRIKMLVNASFFGELATRLKIQKAGDWLPTAATDGKHLYFNEQFLDTLDDEELTFVICHEVLHCAYEHMFRRGSRDPHLWNVAADFVINLEIADAKIGKMPKVGLIDEKYRGLTSNEVYDLLVQEQEEKGDQGYKTLDIHIDPNCGSNGDGDGVSGPIPISEEEAKELANTIRQAVIEAAKNANSSGAGNIPGGVKRLVKELLEPEMDWRQLLQAELPSLFKDDFTFNRYNKKSSSSGGFILPGQDYGKHVEAAIAIDTSGSINSSMLRDFLGEVKGIMDAFDNYELTVFFFDTKGYTLHKFNPDNLNSIEDVEIEGGGGTNFEAIFDRLKSADLVPEKLIVFTDGHPFGTWGDETYCDDVIWIIHGNPTKQAPFGQTVHYDKKKEKTG